MLVALRVQTGLPVEGVFDIELVRTSPQNYIGIHRLIFIEGLARNNALQLSSLVCYNQHR